MTTHFPSILNILNTLTGMRQRLLLLSYTRGPNSKSYLATLEALRQRWNNMPDRQPGTKEASPTSTSSTEPPTGTSWKKTATSTKSASSMPPA